MNSYCSNDTVILQLIEFNEVIPHFLRTTLSSVHNILDCQRTTFVIVLISTLSMQCELRGN